MDGEIADAAAPRSDRAASALRDLEVDLQAMRGGDWRAADALMNRIYGKPEAAVVAHVPPNPVVDVIRALSLEEKLELLHSLKRGEALDLCGRSEVPRPQPIQA